MTKQKLISLIKEVLKKKFQYSAQDVRYNQDDKFEVILNTNVDIYDVDYFVKKVTEYAVVEGELIDLELIHEDTIFRQVRGKNTPILIFSTKILNIYAKGGMTEFNKKMDSEYLKYYKEDYDSIEKINAAIAVKYLQEIAEKNGFPVNETYFQNEKLNPRNHFQMLMQTYDPKTNKDVIIYSAPFVYVDDKHKVVKSKTKVELLNSDWETIKKDIRFKQGGKTDIMGKTMSEFKRGKLHSSSGDVVTKRDQAVAIGLSKERSGKYADGGKIKIKALSPTKIVGLTAFDKPNLGYKGYIVKEYNAAKGEWFFQYMSGNGGGRMIRKEELDMFDFYKPKFQNNPTITL
jgi:hypothetical protein